MIRVVLVSLAMLAVPFIVYAIFEIVRQGPDGKGPRSPRDWERDSVLNLGFVGLALMVGALVYLIATDEGSRDGIYVPPRIENGKLIDGYFNTDVTPVEGED
jgi:hypothetical protein